MRRRKNENMEEIADLKGDRTLIQKRKARLRFKLLNACFLAYTKLILKTCRFKIENKELFRNGIMFAFRTYRAFKVPGITRSRNTGSLFSSRRRTQV